ncbi:MAG: hypothetical protein DWH94_05290 [Planctomycetota bacterium]|nr:MAG: hypothetical protein DWH94_05290 [Planctomycetota bacterium]
MSMPRFPAGVTLTLALQRILWFFYFFFLEARQACRHQTLAGFDGIVFVRFRNRLGNIVLRLDMALYRITKKGHKKYGNGSLHQGIPSLDKKK